VSPRLLQVLSQRPDSTGSGTTLDALARAAARRGWESHVAAALPEGEVAGPVGGLPAERLHLLRFGGDPLDYPIPGMSDVMPYPSTRFSEMSEARWAGYRKAWTRHLSRVVREVRPSIIHSHHLWLVSSLIKEVAPHVPVVTHCHATGLRQMVLCPHLAQEVRSGCARNDRFAVLHGGHADALRREIGVADNRIHVVGAGFREEVFYAHPSLKRDRAAILYAGKLSRAKGVAELLDAFEIVSRSSSEVVLHIAGSGSGPEADALRERSRAMVPRVVLHGQLAQSDLASLMRRCSVFVLPSYYEGLPLVLVEALACGCRLVVTDLAGGVAELATRLGPALRRVPAPGMDGVDRPRTSDLPEFTRRLARELQAALETGPVDRPERHVSEFGWTAVFDRLDAVWRELLA